MLWTQHLHLCVGLDWRNMCNMYVNLFQLLCEQRRFGVCSCLYIALSKRWHMHGSQHLYMYSILVWLYMHDA